MIPTKEQAEKLLKEAAALNPGPWEAHSRCVAHCAEEIAKRCGMNPDKAYILGLLHDIGRRFGVTYLRHVYDGYNYLAGLGYDEVARVCLTHSFERNDYIDDYVGKFDMTEEELADQGSTSCEVLPFLMSHYGLTVLETLISPTSSASTV